MEKAIMEPVVLRKRGRPRGLADTQYDSQALRARFLSRRDLNVNALCEKIGISRETFYYTLRGGRYVSEATVRKVAEGLGFSPEAILKGVRLSEV